MDNLAVLRGAAALVLAMTWEASAPCDEGPVALKAPMVCSRGPDEQYFETRVTIPKAAPAGSVYTVRIEAATSPKISGIGLNYLHDMVTDYFLPQGTSIVPGSPHLVEGSGSENVRGGARVWFERGYVRLQLVGHVENGSTFTPPGLEFQLRVSAAPGASLPLRWVRHKVTANVFLIGDLDISCSPKSGALTLGTTVVTP
jgi:hypothetical protein